MRQIFYSFLLFLIPKSFLRIGEKNFGGETTTTFITAPFEISNILSIYYMRRFELCHCIFANIEKSFGLCLFFIPRVFILEFIIHRKKAVVSTFGYLAVLYTIYNGTTLFLQMAAFCISALSYVFVELSE